MCKIPFKMYSTISAFCCNSCFLVKEHHLLVECSSGTRFAGLNTRGGGTSGFHPSVHDSLLIILYYGTQTNWTMNFNYFWFYHHPICKERIPTETVFIVELFYKGHTCSVAGPYKTVILITFNCFCKFFL